MAKQSTNIINFQGYIPSSFLDHSPNEERRIKLEVGPTVC